MAAVTLAVAFSSLKTHEPTIETPPIILDYENSTAVDATTWVHDLPPGTIRNETTHKTRLAYDIVDSNGTHYAYVASS